MWNDRFAVDELAVSIYSTRDDSGLASAGEASGIIRAAIRNDGRAAVVFPAAPTQNEFLAQLRGETVEEVRRATSKNSARLFQIDSP